jgi:exopolysaccharide biosynthesis protein
VTLVVLVGAQQGCGVRSTVSATARAEGCIVACNAGYFNTRSGACLGNLISDGVVIQNTGRHNGSPPLAPVIASSSA